MNAFTFIFFFLIGLLSTWAGRISGAGGAVVIKPMLDACAPLNISSISFLSGFTVWTMTLMMLLRLRSNPIKIEWKRSSYLVLGALIGGVLGQKFFQYCKHFFSQEDTVGALQSIILISTIVLVFFYVQRKDKIQSLHVHNPFICIILGLILSILAAFIGIGGGPINVAVLSFFLSMGSKEAALNSLFIIFCSQSLSLTTLFCTSAIPPLPLPLVLIMGLSGVLGGLIGEISARKLSVRSVDFLFKTVLSLVILTAVFNLTHFLHLN